MSNLATWASGPLNGACLVTTAGTYANQSPSNVVELVEAGTAGGIIERITFKPLETVTACAINIFSLESGSSVYQLIDTIAVAAETVATTTAITGGSSTLITTSAPLYMLAGQKLYAQTTVSFDILVSANGGTITA